MPIDPQQARRHLAAVRETPGMFLPGRDWKFLTAVAYVEGWLQATDLDAEQAFSEWLGEPSIAFWGTLLRRRYPDWRSPLSELDADADALLIDDLFGALDGFLSSLEA